MGILQTLEIAAEILCCLGHVSLSVLSFDDEFKAFEVVMRLLAHQKAAFVARCGHYSFQKLLKHFLLWTIMMMKSRLVPFMVKSGGVESFFLHENSMEKHKKINSLINYPSQPFFAGVGESPFLTKNLIRL